MSDINAARDLRGFMEDGEEVEAIVFGAWGWGSNDGEPGYSEPGFDDGNASPPVPFDKRGVVLTLDEAEPYMSGWSFSGGYGAPECYAVNVWTNRRVIWVTQYDGSTRLNSAPRNPIGGAWPDMPGG